MLGSLERSGHRTGLASLFVQVPSDTSTPRAVPVLSWSALIQMSDDTKSEYENKIFSENTFLAQIKKNVCRGNLILSQYYIYLYILYIYIYTHPKFCISHQERKSCLLLFHCKLYILVRQRWWQQELKVTSNEQGKKEAAGQKNPMKCSLTPRFQQKFRVLH